MLHHYGMHKVFASRQMWFTQIDVGGFILFFSIVLEGAWEFAQSLYKCLVDLKKALDCVC